MNPQMILAIVQAAATIAGPAFQLAVTEMQVVGADQAKHASALQTFQDAIAALMAVCTPAPVKPTP